MTLVLDNVSKKVGAETWIRDVSLSLERGSLNVLLGPTLAGKTSLMRLMAGLDRRARGGSCVDGNDVTGWPVQRRSVAMVYQQFINYPSLQRLRKHRLAAAGRAACRGRDRRPGSRGRAAPEARALSRSPARSSCRAGSSSAPRSPAPWSSAPSSCCSTSRSPTSITSCARNCARNCPRVFAASGAHLRLRDHRPGGSAAARRPHRDPVAGALTQFGPTAAVYRQPHDLITAHVFSDPPLNLLTARKTGDVVESQHRRTGIGRAVHSRSCRMANIHGRFPRPPSRSRTAAAATSLTIPATVSVSEITGSETFIHLDAAEHRFVALVPGVKRLEPGASVTLYLDPALFLFDDAGRLVRGRFRRAA